MKRTKNEQGIALITVLLIITIFTILGMSAISFTMQGHQLRTYSDDEVEGKMLAEMGLLYFQEYLKDKLDFTQLSSFPSTYSDDITSIVRDLAYEKPSSGERFKVTQLPDGRGAFAIMYEDIKTIPFKDGSDDYTQPYSRMLKVSVIGIPKNAIGDTEKRVIRTRLDSTLYINTIPSPFHYAISTPNELHLFGGSNIIGNIEVGNKMLVSNYYKYNEYQFAESKDKWELVDSVKVPNFNKNQPYIEGKVFLRNSTADLYHLTNTNFTDNSTEEEKPPLPIIPNDPYPLDRQDLKAILSPRGILNETGKISTDKPDIPGMEPPFFELTSTTVEGIDFDGESTLVEYIRAQFDKNYSSTNVTIKEDDSPLALKVGNNWLSTGGRVQDEFTIPSANSFGAGSKIANIYSNQNNIDVSGDAPYQLTARLTSDWLVRKGIRQLYIGPDPTKSAPISDSMPWDGKNHATVEMGTLDSFNPSPSNNEEPFTFEGPIFIKGSLDIVGNIKVKGTIFVDGDVVIRDITNLDVSYPMVIMATGKITISNRNSNKPLNAFIYSESEPIEIYAVDSISRIDGGIATGYQNSDAFIEFNTLRKTNERDLNSRLTIKFNRGIFEEEMPGLPSAHHFFIDTYDMVFSNYQGELE